MSFDDCNGVHEAKEISAVENKHFALRCDQLAACLDDRELPLKFYSFPSIQTSHKYSKIFNLAKNFHLHHFFLEV